MFEVTVRRLWSSRLALGPLFGVLSGCGVSALTDGEDPAALVQVTTITVVPALVTLEPGASQQFTVEGRDEEGLSIPVTVAWDASGGSIDSTGLFTAPAVEGPLDIVAVHAASGLADTARVTTRLAQIGLTDECQRAEPEWVWCDDFDQDRLSSYFEYHDAGGSLVRAPGIGLEGSSGMRAHFGAGQADAGSLRLALGRTPDPYFRPIDQGTLDHRELFWRFYFKHPADWVGGGGDKLTRVMVFSTAGWGRPSARTCGPDHRGVLRGATCFLIRPPARMNRERCSPPSTTISQTGVGWVRPHLRPQCSTRPIWECGTVSRCVRLNDAGQSNGIFRLWIDDEFEAERTGLNWLGDYSEYGLNSINLENYWESGSPVEQERYFDNFVVSTGRIGCL